MSTVNTNDNQNNKKQRLELTWIGKEEHIKLEPRILIEDPQISYGDKNTENMLIHGDNLLALKALEQDFAGRIKCIYIDPPYNTGSAFEHYDDNLEHSTWLNLMKPRLEILRTLLAKDGVIFISISDDECHYLKILCDEIFKRNNFCGTLIWEKKKKPSFLSNMGGVTENILAYAKNKNYSPPFIYGTTTEGKKYPFNNAGNGVQILTFPAESVKFDLQDQIIDKQEMSGGKIITELLDKLEIREGRNVNPFRLKGEWRYSQAKLDEIVENNEEITISKIPFRPNHVKMGGNPKKMKNLLSVAHFEMATYEDATQESITLFGENPFDYPKPEKLVYTLLNSVAKKGDIVLDSFLGSGTTCAVAHKMHLKYIGVELEDHAFTHCAPRLKKVVDNKDALPMSESLKWKGGGGFKFFNLAPSLLKKDKFGNWVIDEKYNPNMLAAAMCKHEGFRYSPDEEIYWKQGKSTENDYIFVTTNYFAPDQLDSIHEEMGSQESLLICAKTYAQECENKYPNITIKKIPQAILGSCEFGADNYDLNIIEMTENIAEEQEEEFDDE